MQVKDRMIKQVKWFNRFLFIKEIFDTFFLYPITFTVIGIFVCGILHWICLESILIIGFGSFLIYNFLWWFYFGQRQKHFHGGDE